MNDEQEIESQDLEKEHHGPAAFTGWPTLPLVGLGITLVANTFAFRPENAGTPLFFFITASGLLLASALCLSLGTPRERAMSWLRPRPGDLSIGALLGGLLVLAVWIGRTRVFPATALTSEWLFGVYVQLGDPRLFERVPFVALLALIGITHELFFHGYLQSLLEERLDARAGYLAAAAASMIAVLPSSFLLAKPSGLPNPLLPLMAALAALVLGAVRRISGRLFPNVVARCVFLYFSVAQFRLPGL